MTETGPQKPHRNSHQHPLHSLHSLSQDNYQHSTSDIYALSNVSPAFSRNVHPMASHAGISVGMSAYPYSLSESPMVLPDTSISFQQYMMLGLLDATEDKTLEVAGEGTHERNNAPPHLGFEQFDQEYRTKMRPDDTNKLEGFTPSKTFSQPSAMTSPMIHSNPHDSSLKIGAETESTTKQRTSNTHLTQADPHAAGYLQQQLGHEKWTIFSTRFSERRLNNTSSKSKTKPKSGGDVLTPPDGKTGCANAIDFLVKVEVVKEVLRTYVPCVFSHPAPSIFRGFFVCECAYPTICFRARLGI
jgi:hypothetical protein